MLGLTSGTATRPRYVTIRAYASAAPHDTLLGSWRVREFIRHDGDLWCGITDGGIEVWIHPTAAEVLWLTVTPDEEAPSVG